MKTSMIIVMALLLSACMGSSRPSREELRLNEIYQTNTDGDVWECKDGECTKIR